MWHTVRSCQGGLSIGFLRARVVGGISSTFLVRPGDSLIVFVRLSWAVACCETGFLKLACSDSLAQRPNEVCTSSATAIITGEHVRKAWLELNVHCCCDWGIHQNYSILESA
jgi:hypothetical protein